MVLFTVDFFMTDLLPIDPIPVAALKSDHTYIVLFDNEMIDI